MPRKDVVIRGAGILVVAGVLAGGGSYVVGGGGGGDPLTANIWIESGAGSCSGGRSSTPIEYDDAGSPDRICGTFDAAWDAMNAGDTARAKDGTYTGVQGVSGDKASTTKIIGESKAGVIIGNSTSQCPVHAGTQGDFSAWCSEADNAWLEDVTVDSGSGTGIGAGTLVWSGVDNVTFVNVDFLGDFPAVRFAGSGGRWSGGMLGDDLPATSRPQMTCTNGAWLPLHLFSAGTVVEDIQINGVNRQDTPTPNTGGCGEDGIPHIETVRFEESADDVTLRRIHFVKGSEIGSGHIFSSTTQTGLKLIGNYFGESGDNPMLIQMGALSATGTEWLYNTFDEGSFSLGTTNFLWVGNLGPDIVGSCSGTHTKNVWGGSGSCGTDTFVGATDLGVDDEGRLEAGSPAIDAAETPDSSDECTDAATVQSVDMDGDTRPSGSICDAGADER